MKNSKLKPESMLQLLDTDRMRRAFRRLPILEGREIEKVTLSSTWIKPARYFNGHYLLQLGDGDFLRASAFAVGHKLATQLVDQLGDHSCDGAAGPSCGRCSSLANRDLLLTLFPHDYRLPTLERCLDAGLVSAEAGSDFPLTGCEVIAYRPGVRCQMRYRDARGGKVYGKVSFRRGTPDRVFEVQRQAWESISRRASGFRVPRPLAFLPGLGMSLVEAVDGFSLDEVLRTGDGLGNSIKKIASALSGFHALEVDGAQRLFGVDQELELLVSWVDFLPTLYPAWGEAVAELFEQLKAVGPAAVEPDAVLHRDFYDKQVILTDGDPVLIDMDTTCRGDRELDLGNFCAHLRLRALQWDEHERSAELERMFRDAYPVEARQERLSWYTAATLLRLACNYSLRPRWQKLVEPLLDETRKQIARAGG